MAVKIITLIIFSPIIISGFIFKVIVNMFKAGIILADDSIIKIMDKAK